jgi:hypothetical protein
MRRAGALSVVNSPSSARADFGSITSFVNTGQSVRLAGGATKGRVRPILAPRSSRHISRPAAQAAALVAYQPFERLLSAILGRLQMTQWSYQSFVDTGLNIPSLSFQNPED